MEYIVYLIIRSDNKLYVGSTNRNRIKKRMYEHSISKRFKGYEWKIKELYSTSNIEDCYEKEEQFIKKYDTFHNGLNESINGRGNNLSKNFTTLGFKFSDDSKKKMSETRKRKLASGEIKPNGPTWSNHQKKQFSKQRKGIYINICI